ncbi:hypothetical protein C8F04DRAFT_1314225 [Mycena alexandri]|uniref:Uncharacterized protein n=1 Tax=Mycena alexandri TaxID=1745969 RepID=A0AAD6WNX5_9AGAR|nr:hypothetical protein C8F04DRAFT_1314225 [Mycena alexandri]
MKRREKKLTYTKAPALPTSGNELDTGTAAPAIFSVLARSVPTTHHPRAVPQRYRRDASRRSAWWERPGTSARSGEEDRVRRDPRVLGELVDGVDTIEAIEGVPVSPPSLYSASSAESTPLPVPRPSAGFIGAAQRKSCSTALCVRALRPIVRAQPLPPNARAPRRTPCAKCTPARPCSPYAGTTHPDWTGGLKLKRGDYAGGRRRHQGAVGGVDGGGRGGK